MAQDLRREENMAAILALVDMAEAAASTGTALGQPGWSLWKRGRLLLSLGRKMDTEHRVETATKLRMV